jgi:hypothetical protein
MEKDTPVSENKATSQTSAGNTPTSSETVLPSTPSTKGSKSRSKAKLGKTSAKKSYSPGSRGDGGGAITPQHLVEKGIWKVGDVISFSWDGDNFSGAVIKDSDGEIKFADEVWLTEMLEKSLHRNNKQRRGNR